MNILDIPVAATIVLFAILIALTTIPFVVKSYKAWQQNRAWKRVHFDYTTKTWINA